MADIKNLAANERIVAAETMEDGDTGVHSILYTSLAHFQEVFRKDMESIFLDEPEAVECQCDLLAEAIAKIEDGQDRIELFVDGTMYSLAVVTI